MRKFILLLILLITAVFLACPSCAKKLSPDGPETIYVKKGTNFTLMLASNPTTGYSWQLCRPLDKSRVRLISSGYQRPKTSLAGAGGKEAWVFKAVSAGGTVICFEYARPWEKDIPPAKKHSFKVIIR